MAWSLTRRRADCTVKTTTTTRGGHMAQAEKITTTEVREVKVERVVLTLYREEAEVINALVQCLDNSTSDALGLRELKEVLYDTVGRQAADYDVRENSLGFLRVTK